MGFKSTFVSLDAESVSWPAWIKLKWRDDVVFGGAYEVASSHEMNFRMWRELFDDIREAIDWDRYEHPAKYRAGAALSLLFVHECGGITRVSIRRNSVTIADARWEEVERTEHTGSHCGPRCRS